MKIKISKRQLKLLVLWSVVILVAPFALETVMLAELVGAELAIGLLLLYMKQSVLILRERLHQASVSIRNMIYILGVHLAFEQRQYVSHASLSLFVIGMGAPVFYAVIIWYPVLIVGTVT